MNTPKPLLLTDEHNEKLEKLVKSGITPALIVHRAIVCQKPKDLGYATKTWTNSALTKHIRFLFPFI